MIKIIALLLLSQIGTPIRDRVQAAVETKKPILAIFSATWCQPCQVMEKAVIEPMEASGELEYTTVLKVDVDRDKEFADFQLGKSYTIPKIFLLFKENGKWIRYELTGYQSRERILQMIQKHKDRNKK